MEIELKKRPKNPIIIEGFPGFGLVGTIATEFLIEHLGAKLIGKIKLKEVPAVVAVHNSQVVDPLGIFYDSKNNIMIVHALTSPLNLEWDLADILIKLARDLKAKEIIAIEGVGSQVELKTPRVFFLGKKEDKLKKIGIEPLKEGIIMGVTGALLLKSNEVPVTSIFAETHSALPDSRAAAKMIEVLDKYLGLKLDYHPLLEKAQQFEEKIKSILEKSKNAQNMKKEKEEVNYLG